MDQTSLEHPLHRGDVTKRKIDSCVDYIVPDIARRVESQFRSDVTVAGDVKRLKGDTF